MTEDTTQITADNLRADFLNATTNWQRWKVLNRALDWAVAATGNAEAARADKQAYTFYRSVVDGMEAAVSVTTPKPGDVVTWDGEEEGWIVRSVGPSGMAVILPLGDDWAFGATRVHVTDL